MSNKFKVPQNPKIFNQEELEAEIQKEKDSKEKKLTYKKSKHSLDSDEEDDDEKAQKYNVLDPNELEGQEERTIDFDGEIKITPFNMKEELEEGYFDKEGTYIFNKEEDEVKDQWLDDIDWIKVKAQKPGALRRDEESESEESDDEPFDLVGRYERMLPLMRAGESVQRAIRRLGGGGSSSSRGASARWTKKKRKGEEEEAVEEKDVEKLQLLTSLADEIVQSGDMDVYQRTFEKMSFCVEAKRKAAGDGLDMFGDEFEEKVDEERAATDPPRSPSPSADALSSEVQWEFKWEEADDARVYGPFPTSQMQRWVEEQYFEGGVLVRQVGKQDAGFYSSKRIDFDLYT